jgi:hypothetical protein
MYFHFTPIAFKEMLKSLLESVKKEGILTLSATILIQTTDNLY